MAKSQDYIVTKKGVCLNSKKMDGEKIGATVKLTPEKAACLIGKVTLKADHNAEVKTDKKLAGENIKMTAKLEDAAEANAALLEANESLVELNTELSEANEELNAQIVKLTESLTGT